MSTWKAASFLRVWQHQRIVRGKEAISGFQEWQFLSTLEEGKVELRNPLTLWACIHWLAIAGTTAPSAVSLGQLLGTFSLLA